MKIRSAEEDFEQVSLAAIAGVLEKLRYLAGLRSRGDDYAHWGLARVYGEEVARDAMAAAHSHTHSAYLGSPLESLAEEMVETARRQGISPEEYIRRLEAHGDRIVPSSKKPGLARHSDAVLLALKKIARVVLYANRQSA